MSIPVWVIIGLIAGWFANLIDHRGPISTAADLTSGIIGALLGAFFAASVTGTTDIWTVIPPVTIFSALIGGIIVLAVIHTLLKRSPNV